MKKMKCKKYIKPQATVITVESQNILASSPTTGHLWQETFEIDTETEYDGLTAF